MKGSIWKSEEKTRNPDRTEGIPAARQRIAGKEEENRMKRNAIWLLMAMMLVMFCPARAELPEEIRQSLTQSGEIEELADTLRITDGAGREWCITVTRFGGLDARILTGEGWQVEWSGYGLFRAEDTRFCRHTPEQKKPDGTPWGDDLGFDIVSDSLGAELSYHWDGNTFALAGWRDKAWPGAVMLTEEAACFYPDDGSEMQAVPVEEELKLQFFEFDELPKTPEEMEKRTRVSREAAQQAFPDWMLARYELINFGKEAEAFYIRVEEKQLYIRRAVFYSDSGRAAEIVDLIPVPITEAFAERLKTEAPDTLVDPAGYGDTFLVPDAVDRSRVRFSGTFLQNMVGSHGIIALTEKDGKHHLEIAEPDERGRWQVKSSKVIASDIRLDLYHSGGDSILLVNEWDQNFGFSRKADGSWALRSVMAEDVYQVTWYGVKTYDRLSGADRLAYGTLHGADLFNFKADRIPKSGQRAASALDREGWAVVNNPNPDDRLHLRTKPKKGQATLGKFYNGTPVQILETDGDWCHVRIGFGHKLEGWMMEKFLAQEEEIDKVQPMLPTLMLKEEYIGKTPSVKMNIPAYTTALTGREEVIGLYEDKTVTCYIVADEDGNISYVPQDWYDEGNG